MKNTIIQMIENNEATLVYSDKINIYKDSGIGVKPIISKIIIDQNHFKDCLIADTIIGKAAALLLVLSGASFVYGTVMSRHAVEIFKSNHIEYQYETLVDYIKNRKGTGLCPLEDAVIIENDPTKALYKIENRIIELMKNNGGK